MSSVWRHARVQEAPVASQAMQADRFPLQQQPTLLLFSSQLASSHLPSICTSRRPGASGLRAARSGAGNARWLLLPSTPLVLACACVSCRSARALPSSSRREM